MRCGRFILVALIVGAVAATPARAQQIMEVLSGEEWLDRWWSWAFWWEGNAEGILAETQPGATERGPSAEAERVILAVAEDAAVDEGVRLAAIVALGRMDAGVAVPKLIEWSKDPSPAVATAAWLALGEVRSPEADAYLLDAARGDAPLPVFVALGLKDPASPPIRERGMKTLMSAAEASKNPWAQAMAIFAMRQLFPERTAGIAPRWVRNATEAPNAIEAMMALSTKLDRPELSLLSDIYYDKEGDISRIPARLAFGDGVGFAVDWDKSPVAIRVAAAIALTRQDPVGRQGERNREQIAKALRRPYELVPNQNGRDMNRWRIDHSWFAGPSPEMGAYEMRWGLVALGSFAEEEGVDLLLDVLRGRTETLSDHPAAYPGRGFAAIGLGRYLASRNDPKRDAGNKKSARRAIRELASIITAADEAEQLRAAAILALGLSGSDDAGAALRDALRERPPRSVLASGFTVLALSLLGDHQNAIAMAEHALRGAPPADASADAIRQRFLAKELSVADGLGLRAMFYGLGISSGPKADALLKAGFGLERFTAEAAARGLRMRGNADLAPPLLELVRDEDANVARMAAETLGELFDADGVNRLRQRFVSDSVFIWPVNVGDLSERLRKVPIYGMRTIAHPFFYETLVPSREAPRQ